GNLHRNFMGYTTCATELLIGLGASSISDAKYGYLQNEKKIEDYKARIAQCELAIFKGHLHTPEDLLRKSTILQIACQGKLDLSPDTTYLFDPATDLALAEMQEEGLVELEPDRLQVTPLGQAFIRNICMLFDQKVKESEQ